MSADSRVAKLERALSPRRAVLLWFETANQHGSLLAYAQACLAQADPAADLNCLHDQVEAYVSDARPGDTPWWLARITRRELHTALFLYQLVVVLNDSVEDTVQLALLQSLVLIGQLSQLVSDPPSGDVEARRGDPERARRIDPAWQSWRTAVHAWVAEVRVGQLARASIADRYFAGRAVLFTAAAERWTQLGDQADRLEAMIETLREPYRTWAGSVRTPETEPEAIAHRAEGRASEVTDDARIASFMSLGDRDRALAIVERRLRS